jgi:hypothetical protein
VTHPRARLGSDHSASTTAPSSPVDDHGPPGFNTGHSLLAAGLRSCSAADFALRLHPPGAGPVPRSMRGRWCPSRVPPQDDPVIQGYTFAG